jgi:hypothetical protein
MLTWGQCLHGSRFELNSERGGQLDITEERHCRGYAADGPVKGPSGEVSGSVRGRFAVTDVAADPRDKVAFQASVVGLAEGSGHRWG